MNLDDLFQDSTFKNLCNFNLEKNDLMKIMEEIYLVNSGP